MRRVVMLVVVLAGLVCATRVFSFWPFKARPGSDPAVELLLEEICRRQPAPYALPEDNTFNYIWAQYMCSFLAAERCGYLPREEAVARLKGMLDTIEPLERHHGFSYDAYDLETGKKTTDKIYFQGWWIYTLVIIRNAYPELADSCQRMLDEIDYVKGGMLNVETRDLAADQWPGENRVNWCDLHVNPAGEFRTPYMAYTYVTGDISPWTVKRDPNIVTIYGHPSLSVWHNFVFCAMLVHSVFPDLGYFDRSWDEMLKGVEAYRVDQGMTFHPTRAERLEEGRTIEPPDKWPNTEHRIAKPWLSWFVHRNAPVIEKAFSPGMGVTLYADNMNFYWCYGDTQTVCDRMIGTDADSQRVNASWALPFKTFPLAPDDNIATRVELKGMKFYASCDTGALRPRSPLIVALDGLPIAEISPGEIGSNPTLVELAWDGNVLETEDHVLTLSTDETEPGRVYRLYEYENALWHGVHRYQTPSGEQKEEQTAPPYAEIILDGQYRGGENPYALLARCAVVHGYYPWHEMLDDPQFYERTVVWVGDYAQQASLGRIVHNVSDTAVQVEYKRPKEWKDRSAVRVADITDESETPVPVTVKWRKILWDAEPRHTYRISYGL